MPFKSEKQRRYLWARHPGIARKWTQEAKVAKYEPRFGNGGTVGRRMTDDEPVSKRYRDYDPERKRQRQIGAAETAIGLGGAGAAGYGGHRIYRDTKALRASAKKSGKGGVFLKPKGAGALVGGTAALSTIPVIRRWSESNRGKPWGS